MSLSQSQVWRRNWARITPFFHCPSDIRKAIYTTNSVESLNRSLRKIIKTRGVFPHEEAALKLLFLALRQANPCGVRAVVSPARLRQANCYYSSSDAQFADRYEALAAYAKVHTGEVAFEGGWRVYSSGAGIAVRLIHECLLGIRKTASVLVVDPVIPKALDGLCVDIELAGKPVQVVYRVAASGSGPTALTLNGTALPFEREANPYRTGGAAVPMAALRRLLTAAANTLEVQLQ